MTASSTAAASGQMNLTVNQAPASAIEVLEGQTVRLMLRDNTVLQGKLERIGWLSAESEGISYLCLKLENDSGYILAAQGITTRSGMVFIPWDWVGCLVVP